jgi:hypothetical protein
MIGDGRFVNLGCFAVLLAARLAVFLFSREHDADRDLLAGLLQRAGCMAAPGDAGGLLIEAPGISAADLNRLAAQNGITLRQLAERTRSLERAFFALTGTKSADVPAGQEMGAIR